VPPSATTETFFGTVYGPEIEARINALLDERDALALPWHELIADRAYCVNVREQRTNTKSLRKISFRLELIDRELNAIAERVGAV